VDSALAREGGSNETGMSDMEGEEEEEEEEEDTEEEADDDTGTSCVFHFSKDSFVSPCGKKRAKKKSNEKTERPAREGKSKSN
jgi:hypothetical protein